MRKSLALLLLFAIFTCCATTAVANEIKISLVITSYTPNSGTAEGCLNPQTLTCTNVNLTATEAIRPAFDGAVPGLLGKSVTAMGYYTAPGQFTVTQVPR